MARGVWLGVGFVAPLVIVAVVSAIRRGGAARSADRAAAARHQHGSHLDIGVTCLAGLCLALPVIGGGDSLAQAAHELEPPRVQGLWRAARVTLVFALMVTALATFLFVTLVPPDEQSLWVAPRSPASSSICAGPGWLPACSASP